MQTFKVLICPLDSDISREKKRDLYRDFVNKHRVPVEKPGRPATVTRGEICIEFTYLDYCEYRRAREGLVLLLEPSRGYVMCTRGLNITNPLVLVGGTNIFFEPADAPPLKYMYDSHISDLVGWFIDEFNPHHRREKYNQVLEICKELITGRKPSIISNMKRDLLDFVANLTPAALREISITGRLSTGICTSGLFFDDPDMITMRTEVTDLIAFRLLINERGELTLTT